VASFHILFALESLPIFTEVGEEQFEIYPKIVFRFNLVNTWLKYGCLLFINWKCFSRNFYIVLLQTKFKALYCFNNKLQQVTNPDPLMSGKMKQKKLLINIFN